MPRKSRKSAQVIEATQVTEAAEVQQVVDSAPVSVDKLSEKFGVVNQRTQREITRKMSAAHAIETVLNSETWKTPAEMKAELAVLGISLTEARIKSHCEFYTAGGKGARKTPTIEANGKGKFRKIAEKSWFTANPDGSQKLVKVVKEEK